jgi:hypothetical protein
VRDHWLFSSNGGKSRSSGAVGGRDPIDGGLRRFSRSKESCFEVLEIKVDSIEHVVSGPLTNLGSIIGGIAIERGFCGSSTCDHDDRTLGVGVADGALLRTLVSGTPNTSKISRIVVQPKC